jgi:hypothetical protein
VAGLVEQIGLDELRLRERGSDLQERLSGQDDTPLRDRTDFAAEARVSKQGQLARGSAQGVREGF